MFDTSRDIPRFVVALLSILASAIVAVETSMASASTPQQNQSVQYEITSLEFNGNDAFSNSELLQLIRTRETPGFVSKTLHGWFESLGRPNEYYDPVALGEDLSRLIQHYKDNGFQDIRIDTVLTFAVDRSSIEIRFDIEERYHSTVDTLYIRGLPFDPQRVLDDALIRQGDHFSKALLEEEVKRLIQVLNNEGYARAQYIRDSSWARYFVSTKNYSVVLFFDPRGHYRFGETFVVNEDTTRTDIDDVDVVRQLDFEKDDVYNVANLKSSEKNLNRTGVFDLARITVQLPQDSPDSSYVTTRVRIRPKDKHELAPELSFSDENLNFNLGVGLGYSNRNFFGGTRTASTKIRFRTATIDEYKNFFRLESDAIANLEVTFELLQPYVFTNNIKGSWAFSWIRDKQQIYLSSILQNKFGFSIQFAEFTSGYLDWTTQLVKLDARKGITIDSSNTQQLIQLRDLANQAKEEQFNSILSFTIQRDKTNDIFSPSRGFVHSFTIEESGVLPSLLRSWGLSSRPFTQFYRTNVMGRWYFDVSNDTRFSIVAMKLRAGFEEKYGGSKNDDSVSIPQTHRFYAGGGGSIRGWSSRSLTAAGEPLLGGNMIIEGSMELRTNILQSLKDDFWDRLWLVLFADAGNVWPQAKNLQLRTVALATGFGIRYDTFFGPFRIDYGFQVYNPASQRWITERKFWSETLGSGILHFGIGHAF